LQLIVIHFIKREVRVTPALPLNSSCAIPLTELKYAPRYEAELFS
jgi:hypothetical protein